jgi:hypothetical protein
VHSRGSEEFCPTPSAQPAGEAREETTPQYAFHATLAVWLSRGSSNSPGVPISLPPPVRTGLDDRDDRDGLVRLAVRVERSKSPMSAGLGTVVRVKWGMDTLYTASPAPHIELCVFSLPPPSATPVAITTGRDRWLRIVEFL